MAAVNQEKHLESHLLRFTQGIADSGSSLLGHTGSEVSVWLNGIPFIWILHERKTAIGQRGLVEEQRHTLWVR